MAPWPQSMMQLKMMSCKFESYPCLWKAAHRVPHHDPHSASSILGIHTAPLLSCTCGEGGDGDNPAEGQGAHTHSTQTHKGDRKRLIPGHSQGTEVPENK